MLWQTVNCCLLLLFLPFIWSFLSRAKSNCRGGDNVGLSAELVDMERELALEVGSLVLRDGLL